MNLMAREVCEKVSEHMDEHLLIDHDFKQELEEMDLMNEKKQLDVISRMDALIITRKVQLDKLQNNQELALIIKLLQKPPENV